MDINTLTITKAHEALVNKEFTAVELAETCLQTIEEKDKDIHAYLEVFDDVLEQAKVADERIQKGEADMLTGIPLALKDNILIAGKRAGAASSILEGYHATYDATVTKKLKEAGALFIGRTNMDDSAMGASTESSAYGITKNPLDTSRVPGGSSGGSAAAVAGDMALGGFGSDTGGSVRLPGAFCGLVGLRPTYGSVSRNGLIALASSLDVIGPLAKTVEDSEILFNAVKGKDVMDSTTVDENDYAVASLDSHHMKIGVPRKFLEESGLDEKVFTNFKAGLERLESLGHEIVDIELPNVKYAVPTYYIVLPAEASANLARFDGVRFGLHKDGNDLIGDYFATKGAGYGPEPKRRIIIGTYVLSAGYYDAYYNRANAVRALIQDDHTKAFAKVDVIATPTSAGPAFKIGDKGSDPVKMYLEDIFTAPASLTGMPAISVPSGTVEEQGSKLPLGMQFVAPHMQENLLFELGKQFYDASR